MQAVHTGTDACFSHVAAMRLRPIAYFDINTSLGHHIGYSRRNTSNDLQVAAVKLSTFRLTSHKCQLSYSILT
jgi:hypothetical protein